jgi:hypothetical protein
MRINSLFELDRVSRCGASRLRQAAWPAAARKIQPVAAGVALLWISGAHPVFAANGYHYVMACSSCQTTGDYLLAAESEAISQQNSGHYQVVSFSQASTAYIHVILKMVANGGEPIWTLQSATPVDSSGNSLAGNSEADNESYFASLDQVIFGASRNEPQSINEPTAYSSSFINSTEEEVAPGIGYAFGQLGINPGSIAVGTVITVKFDDGTTAQYVKLSALNTYQWSWNGIAHNKDGKLIHRDGTLVVNPNTAGGGGGDVGAPGFGAGRSWNFDLGGYDQCTMQTTVTVSGEAATAVLFSPC